MTDPTTDERRPAEAPPTSTQPDVPSLPSADADRTHAHCSICGHLIHTPASLARGTGPVCAGRVVDLEGVDRG